MGLIYCHCTAANLSTGIIPITHRIEWNTFEEFTQLHSIGACSINISSNYQLNCGFNVKGRREGGGRGTMIGAWIGIVSTCRIIPVVNFELD